MNTLKPALIALLIACTCAYAQQEPAPAPERSAVPEVKPPPKRKPLKRRSVQQVIEPTPRIVTEPYRPVLEVRPSAPLSQPIPGPVRMNSCDGAGCTDTNGNRFNGGIGTTLIGPQGQLCNKGLVNAQCF
ncbi:hypothetical protein Q4S45_03595 [Massilia sp. R2A-15]|uniref:hypothetical protein n=1 Tax=Massilia sp. R2A-15 TaxID=3064278 RepID=UPI0027339DB7|nr:hypothetical protein [Massilia sp. R2A-15]WLI90219.1 hypothetical protein Q4S45_03595 [Massilia sp. R2A-15]